MPSAPPDPSFVPAFRLRHLSVASRLGLTCLIVVFGIGLATSLQLIVDHHQNRDGQPGVSITDVKGAYHGVFVPAPFVTALERGHPAPPAPPASPVLPAASRDALMDWLLGKKDAAGKRPVGGNPRLIEEYDSIDLGDAAPIEIIARSCLSCHSAKGAEEIAAKAPAGSAAKKWGGWPLHNLEGVKKIAYEKRIDPPPLQILTKSTHAHAISLATMSVALGALLVLTRWPRSIIGVLIGVAGAGLLMDIGGWWIARKYAAAVYMIMAGGAAYSATNALTLVAIFLELWLPKRGL